jgi:hypothetical protein
MRLDWLTAKHGARRGVHWPQPCLKHARPRHARPAQPAFSAQDTHDTTADSTHVPRTATTALKSMCSLGGPVHRGTAVLRRDGRHPGKVNRTTRLGDAGHHRTRPREEGRIGWPCGAQCGAVM